MCSLGPTPSDLTGSSDQKDSEYSLPCKHRSPEYMWPCLREIYQTALFAHGQQQGKLASDTTCRKNNTTKGHVLELSQQQHVCAVQTFSPEDRRFCATADRDLMIAQPLDVHFKLEDVTE